MKGERKRMIEREIVQEREQRKRDVNELRRRRKIGRRSETKKKERYSYQGSRQ